MSPTTPRTSAVGENFSRPDARSRGFAQGIAARVRAEPGSVTLTMVTQTYSKQLIDHFDYMCSNNCNQVLELSDLTTVVNAELLGVHAARVEESLRVLRAGGPDARSAMLAILQGR